MRFWYHDLSLYRLSRPAEIRELFNQPDSESLFAYYARRQFTLRASFSGLRRGSETFHLQTDSYSDRPPRSRLSAAERRSLRPAGARQLRRFRHRLSGATPRYSLEQSVDLFEQLSEQSANDGERPCRATNQAPSLTIRTRCI